MDKAAFGAFLAQLRNESNLTQEQLAEKINVSYKTVSKWECGNCLPDLDTLVKIANIFDVTLYELTVEYKRIKNPFLTKNNINRIINKRIKNKFIIINIILSIIALLMLIFAICCCVYTIKNYNQIQIYELVSENKYFYVKGIFIKNFDQYHLTITKIELLNSEYASKNHKTNELIYTIRSDNFYETNQINFDEYYKLKDILKSFSISVSNKPLIDTINKFTLRLEYENENNEKNMYEFEIKLADRKRN